EVTTMQQMGLQRRGPAEVMGNHHRPYESPMRQHLGEHLSLHVERRGLLGSFVRPPIPGHVVPMNAEAARKIGNEAMPRKRRPRPAMREHEWRSASQPTRCNPPSGSFHRLIEFP